MKLSSKVSTKILGIIVLSALPPSPVSAAERAIAARCGDCHNVSTELNRTEFDDLLASYNWAQWTSIPLRVWLSNHHKPRIPSINITEAEAARIKSYVAELNSRKRVGSEGVSAAEAFFADTELDAREDQIDDLKNNGVEQDEQNHKDDNVGDGNIVDFSDCLNC